MKPKTHRNNLILLGAISSTLAAPAAFAAGPYYWDNLAGAGFGNAGGNWGAPTAGPIPGWNTDATGAAAPASVTTANGEILNFGTSTLGLGSGTVSINTDVNAGNITIGSASGDIILKLTGTSRLTSGATTGTYASTLTLKAGSTFEQGSGGTQTISGIISGGTVKASAGGGLILSNSGNTYSDLQVAGSGGRVFLNTNVGSLPAAATVSISNGGTLVFGAAATRANAITLSSTGQISARGATTLSNLTMPGSGSIIFNNDDSNTNPLIISNGQTLSGSLGIQIGGSRMLTTTGALGQVTMSGKLTGAGSLTLTSGGNSGNVNGLNGSGTLILSNTGNDYTGDTSVTNGMLRLGAANVIPDGAGKGNVSVAGTLDLNAFSETINGFSGAGTVDTLAGGTPTLTVGGNGGGGTFSGAIKNTAGTLALTKTGSGDIILTGTNTYNGLTTLSNGRLFISGANALSPNTSVQVNGGRFTFNVAGTPTYTQGITLASGGGLSQRQAATLSNVTLPTSGSVVLNHDDQPTVAFSLNSAPVLAGPLTVQVGGPGGNATVGAVTLAGNLTGGGGLTKTEVGTLILSGTNTYSGTTLVSAGTLFVTGSLTGNVTVSDTATVGGGGAVGNLSLGGGSFLDIALALGGNPLDATGTISFAAAGFGINNLVFNGGAVDWSTVADGTYTLLTGTLNSLNLDNFGLANAFNLGGGRSAYFQSGSLQLVVIPEPNVAALIGALGGILLLRRRR